MLCKHRKCFIIALLYKNVKEFDLFFHFELPFPVSNESLTSWEDQVSLNFRAFKHRRESISKRD